MDKKQTEQRNRKQNSIMTCVNPNSKKPISKGGSTLKSPQIKHAKTITACKFLAQGISEKNQRGILVTFEKSPSEIRKMMLKYGWNITQWEKEGKWKFVDASTQTQHETLEIGGYDLNALLARIEYAVNKIGAKRICLDSVESISKQLKNTQIVRNELFRIARRLRGLGFVVLMTTEASPDNEKISETRMEESFADNIIFLRNESENEKPLLKAKLSKYQKCAHPIGEIICESGMI